MSEETKKRKCITDKDDEVVDVATAHEVDVVKRAIRSVLMRHIWKDDGGDFKGIFPEYVSFFSGDVLSFEINGHKYMVDVITKEQHETQKASTIDHAIKLYADHIFNSIQFKNGHVVDWCDPFKKNVIRFGNGWTTIVGNNLIEFQLVRAGRREEAVDNNALIKSLHTDDVNRARGLLSAFHEDLNKISFFPLQANGIVVQDSKLFVSILNEMYTWKMFKAKLPEVSE